MFRTNKDTAVMYWLRRELYNDKVFSGKVGTLEEVRGYYDLIGQTYGFKFKLVGGFTAELDYFPTKVVNEWRLGWTLYHGSEIGEILSMDVGADGEAVLKMKNFVLTIKCTGLQEYIDIIAKGEKDNARERKDSYESRADDCAVKSRFV